MLDGYVELGHLSNLSDSRVPQLKSKGYIRALLFVKTETQIKLAYTNNSVTRPQGRRGSTLFSCLMLTTWR